MAPYVLVVQSDPDLGRQIGDTLREAAYEISTEAEAAWARRSLVVRAPDALVVDTSLSDGTGFTVADALRADPDTKATPIYFVASRFRGQGHATEARRRYAPAEYLTAPLSLDTLLANLLARVPPTEAVPSATAADDSIDYTLSDQAQKEEGQRVEQAAAELAKDHTGDLHGGFDQQPFARVLQRIYATRRSGALLAQRDPIKKIVYFQDGYPVSVRSNVLRECLGQVLLREKLISKKALDESLRRMREEMQQQGALLVQMGALSPYNLQRALLLQMEGKICELFSWKVGTYAFNDSKRPRGESVRLKQTPAALILEGIGRHYSQERQQAVLLAFAGQYPTPSHDPLRRLQDVTRDAAERKFIASIDGTRCLEAILESAPIPMARARLLLVAMSEAGMIEPGRTAGTMRPGLSEDLLFPPESSGLGDLPPEQGKPEDLAAALETMAAQTHFEVLGVGAGADPDTVELAYERLARTFHPDRFRFRADDVRAIAREIFDRLDEARAVLGDPAARQQYVAMLEQELRVPLPGLAPSAAAEKIYASGVEHLHARRYHEAASAFRHAVGLLPTKASYRGALGWALYRESPATQDAIEAGLAELKQAVALDGKDPWVRVSLGRFYAETGRVDDAINEFQIALGANPGFTDIEEEIRRLKGET